VVLPCRRFFSPNAMPAQFHQALQSAELLERGAYSGFAMILPGDVAFDKTRALAEFRGQRFALLPGYVGDDRVAAGGNGSFPRWRRPVPRRRRVTMKVLFLISMLIPFAGQVVSAAQYKGDGFSPKNAFTDTKKRFMFPMPVARLMASCRSFKKETQTTGRPASRAADIALRIERPAHRGRNCTHSSSRKWRRCPARSECCWFLETPVGLRTAGSRMPRGWSIHSALLESHPAPLAARSGAAGASVGCSLRHGPEGAEPMSPARGVSCYAAAASSRKTSDAGATCTPICEKASRFALPSGRHRHNLLTMLAAQSGARGGLAHCARPRATQALDELAECATLAGTARERTDHHQQHPGSMAGEFDFQRSSDLVGTSCAKSFRPATRAAFTGSTHDLGLVRPALRL